MGTHDDEPDEEEDGGLSNSDRHRHAEDWASGVPVVERATVRARTHRTDDDRALVGREQRAIERVSTAARRRYRARSNANGVPIVIPDMIERELGGADDLGGREITEPWEILDREELTPDEQRIIQRSKRDSSDPLTFADGAKIMSRVIRRELDQRSEEKKRANELLDILDRPPAKAAAQINGRLAAIEKRTKFWNRVLWVIAIAIGGGLFEAATRLWDRSAHETALEYKLEDARENNKRQDAAIAAQAEEIKHLRNLIESDSGRSRSSQHSSSKDNQP